jgi:murein DD-endopeptidase MepM/ murein hydrolase activator NlpD
MSYPFSQSSRASRAIAVLFLLAASLPRIAAAQAIYHVLEKGETLYSIARAYGIKPEAIAEANSIDDPSKLRAGKKLLIPGKDGETSARIAGETLRHKIAKGETLFSIAKSYGVGLEALRAANKLTPSSVIKAGDTLVVPAPARVMPVAVNASVSAPSGGLVWPCPGDILYLDGKAYGVVIRAKLGETLRAVASGIVSSAGPYRGYGNVVFVLARGYIYVYGGNDSISVRAGDQVKAGQELGKVGMDAKQGGPAAYFLVFKNGAAVDPASAPRD